jgi:hypothetical protein
LDLRGNISAMFFCHAIYSSKCYRSKNYHGLRPYGARAEPVFLLASIEAILFLEPQRRQKIPSPPKIIDLRPRGLYIKINLRFKRDYASCINPYVSLLSVFN